MFFPIVDFPKIQKSAPEEPPWKHRSLGPCPDDRAQNSVQDSLNESSVRPNPTLVFAKTLFQFCHFCPPSQYGPTKIQKSIPDGPPWKPSPSGPCPDDRAHNSVQDSLNESSVRANPTLVFSEMRFQFWPPQYRPKPPPKIYPLEGIGCLPAAKKEIPNRSFLF